MSRPPQEALFGFASLHEKLRQLQLDATLTTETSADGTTTTTLRLVVPGVCDNRAGAARSRHHYNYRQGRKERKQQQSDRGSMTEKAPINTQAAAVLEPVVTDTRKPLPAQPLPAPPPGLGAPGLGAPGLGASTLGAEPEKESIKTHSTAVLAPDVQDTRQPSPAQPLPAPLQPVESAMGAPNPTISTTRRPSPSSGNGEKKREQITNFLGHRIVITTPTPARESIGPHARFCNNPVVIQQNRIIQEAEIEKRRLLEESRFRPSYHNKDLCRQDDIIRRAKDTMEDIALANNF